MRMRMMGRRFGNDDDEEKRPKLSRESIAIYGRLLAYVRPYVKWMVVSTIALES